MCPRTIRSAQDESVVHVMQVVRRRKHAAADRLVVLPIPITLSAVIKPRGGHGPRVGTCWEPMVPGPRETVGSSALSVKGAGKPRVKP